jgi:two-component system sensor histidine kinase/response regulator
VETPPTDPIGADPVGARILVVDDQPENLHLITDFLIGNDYKLVLASSGSDALSSLETSLPDLILLDVDMPDINGFEVCRRIKADPATSSIPVVFMTGMRDRQTKLEGLKLGAVDYLVKPIAREELLLRMQTHLKLSFMRRSLTAQNAMLEERNAELQAYAHTIAHSLKTPLAASIRFLDILTDFNTENLTSEQHHLAKQALTTLESSGRVIDDLLLLSTASHEQVERETMDMAKPVAEALRQLSRQRKEAQATVHLPKAWLPVVGYGPWVGEVWLNYLSNAFRYCPAPVELKLGCAPEGENMVRFWAHDNGTPLTATQCEQLFVPFSRLHRDKDGGHGLGLTIVERIIGRLGGVAGIDTPASGGNCFFFTLPRDPNLSVK